MPNHISALSANSQQSVSAALSSVWQPISAAIQTARALIPREYHLYLVCGIIVFCAAFTVLSIVFLTKRVVKRHSSGPAHLDETSLNQLDYIDLGITLAANAIVIIGIFIAALILLGIVNLIVIIGGYVALVGLITTACNSYNRKQKIQAYLYDSHKRVRPKVTNRRGNHPQAK